MANDKNNYEHKQRVHLETPETGAEAQADQRVREPELPATDNEDSQNLDKLRAEASKNANQTIDDGAEEVQGRAAVPREKVMKRGSTKWVDDDGFHKELNDAEVNARIAEREEPEYLKLHRAVLEGAEPIAETLKFQSREADEEFAEGKLAEAEKHPRTGGLGPAASRPENQQKRADKERK